MKKRKWVFLFILLFVLVALGGLLFLFNENYKALYAITVKMCLPLEPTKTLVFANGMTAELVGVSDCTTSPTFCWSPDGRCTLAIPEEFKNDGSNVFPPSGEMGRKLYVRFKNLPPSAADKGFSIKCELTPDVSTTAGGNVLNRNTQSGIETLAFIVPEKQSTINLRIETKGGDKVLATYDGKTTCTVPYQGKSGSAPITLTPIWLRNGWPAVSLSHKDFGAFVTMVAIDDMGVRHEPATRSSSHQIASDITEYISWFDNFPKDRQIRQIEVRISGNETQEIRDIQIYPNATAKKMQAVQATALAWLSETNKYYILPSKDGAQHFDFLKQVWNPAGQEITTTLSATDGEDFKKYDILTIALQTPGESGASPLEAVTLSDATGKFSIHPYSSRSGSAGTTTYPQKVYTIHHSSDRNSKGYSTVKPTALGERFSAWRKAQFVTATPWTVQYTFAIEKNTPIPSRVKLEWQLPNAPEAKEQWNASGVIDNIAILGTENRTPHVLRMVSGYPAFNWKDLDTTKTMMQAWQPQGEAVTNQEEQKVLTDCFKFPETLAYFPICYDQSPARPVCVFGFYHPAFDNNSLVNISLYDSKHQPIKDIRNATTQNDPQFQRYPGWRVQPFLFDANAQPERGQVELRYSVGKWAYFTGGVCGGKTGPVDKEPIVVHSIKDVDGGKALEVCYNVTLPGTENERQYQMVAFRGNEEILPTSQDFSLDGKDGGKYTARFNISLKWDPRFYVRYRDIQRVQFDNVVFRNAGAGVLR